MHNIVKIERNPVIYSENVAQVKKVSFIGLSFKTAYYAEDYSKIKPVMLKINAQQYKLCKLCSAI